MKLCVCVCVKQTPKGDLKADTFYVVNSGTFVAKVDEVKVKDYEKGGNFGDLALLYDAPRAATVQVLLI